MVENYELVNTPAGAQRAFNVLRMCQYIFLDCEGRDLGTKNGELGLLQLGSPNATYVFLIDVLALEEAELSDIFSLLTNNSIMKVVWDGRMDDTELLFGHGVKMAGALDLQLVDIVSRKARAGREGVYEYERLRRMIRNEMPLATIRKMQTEGMHVLCSMDRAIQEHRLVGVPKKDGKPECRSIYMLFDWKFYLFSFSKVSA